MRSAFQQTPYRARGRAELRTTVVSDTTAAILPADKRATLVFYCANEHCVACHRTEEDAAGGGALGVEVAEALDAARSRQAPEAATATVRDVDIR
jgi:mono/diheme cytochrome c family protein